MIDAEVDEALQHTKPLPDGYREGEPDFCWFVSNPMSTREATEPWLNIQLPENLRACIVDVSERRSRFLVVEIVEPTHSLENHGIGPSPLQNR